MGITSYAQNFEDVMLWRALGHIEQGYYIDIGAHHPMVDSVSLAFYERGWRGLHVEPLDEYASLIRQARPEEEVLQVAISDHRGIVEFYQYEGLSTADPQIVLGHEARGIKMKKLLVPVVTLADIYERVKVTDIHWMKIDVEGLEKQVLEGWGASTLRPWIVVIESTLPMTTTESYSSWESLIISRGYEYQYFDGLNRYYTHQTHPELAGAFTRPPNVFDGFTLNGTASASFHQHIQSTLNAQKEQMQKANDELVQNLHVQIEQLNKAQNEIQHIRHQAELAQRENLHATNELLNQARSQYINKAQAQLEAQITQQIEREREYSLQLNAHKAHEQNQLRDIHNKHLIQLEQLAHEYKAREQKLEARIYEVQNKLIDITSLYTTERKEQAQAHLSQLMDMQRQLDQEHQVEIEGVRQSHIAQTTELQAQSKIREERLHEQIAAFCQEMRQQHDTYQQQLLAQQAHHEARERAHDHERHQLTERYHELTTQHSEVTQELHTQQLQFVTSKQTLEMEIQEYQRQLAHSLDELARIKSGWAWRLFSRLYAHSAKSEPTPHNWLPPQRDESRGQNMSSPDNVNQKQPESKVPISTQMSQKEHSMKQNPIPLAHTIDELLSYHDTDFVVCAYRSLLGRAPDQEGMNYYTNRIRTGHSKLTIIRQLLASDEAKRHPQTVRGVSKRLKQDTWRRLPLIGWLIKLFDGHSELELRMNALENTIYYMSRDLATKIISLDLNNNNCEIEHQNISSAVVPKEFDNLTNDAQIYFMRIKLANLQKKG